MSVVSNRPLEEHPLVLCPPETCLPQPWPLLFSVSWLLLYHMCSFALYMPNAFLGPDMETILILFMFHLLACSAVWLILQSSNSYSCFRLHLSYYHHYLFILMRLFLNGLLTPLSLLLLFGPNSLHPPVCWHHSTSIQDDVQIIETSYCLTAHDLECLQLKDPILFPSYSQARNCFLLIFTSLWLLSNVNVSFHSDKQFKCEKRSSVSGSQWTWISAHWHVFPKCF